MVLLLSVEIRDARQAVGAGAQSVSGANAVSRPVSEPENFEAQVQRPGASWRGRAWCWDGRAPSVSDVLSTRPSAGDHGNGHPDGEKRSTAEDRQADALVCHRAHAHRYPVVDARRSTKAEDD